jgi:hypothetical protein
MISVSPLDTLIQNSLMTFEHLFAQIFVLAMNLSPNQKYLLLDNVIFELHMMLVWMVDSYKQIDFMDKFSLCKICLDQSNTFENSSNVWICYGMGHSGTLMTNKQ